MAVGLLFYVLGTAAFGGVVFMVLSVPLGKWTTKKTQAFQKILMTRKDDRMSIVGETLQVRGRGREAAVLFATSWVCGVYTAETEHAWGA